MSRLRGLLADRRGAAAAELVLVMPMVLILMFGAVELGRFFWSEHQLVKAVRDASIYAARQRIDYFDCTNATVNSGVVTSTRNLVRTGVLSGGTDRLPHWDDEGASINVTLACVTSAGGTTLGGIYTGHTGQLVPVLTINATVPHELVLKGFGLSGDYALTAKQQAAVMGV